MYIKVCNVCALPYRYQEHKDGIHNFNDNWTISLHLLEFLRHSQMSHTAVGSVIAALENTLNQKLPTSIIIRGLEHFEALSQRSYNFTCVTCGIEPPVLITDLQKKACFSLDVSGLELPELNEENDMVDVQSFWSQIKKEKLINGLLAEKENNPFSVKAAYTNWAPYIGEKTRANRATNSEHRKVIRETSQLEVDCRETSEERLLEMLHSRHVKVSQLKHLCKTCGIQATGSKHDIVLRIRSHLSKDSVFNKVFSNVWGASGGWLSASCPHRIVYGVKFLVRAERPRDHVDLIKSFAKQPPVIICDMPHMVARHGNKRTKGKMFKPHEGRLLEPTEQNIKAAKEGFQHK
ncbi:HMG domain-containing protein 3-like [Antedon mediterranea]|uniref:HMG domain-containing protein 3-like n=1 Tax=Antedon mediterranea TaxID=105859 RepID=UPI003AF9E236